jgi:hypothetical protein
MDQQNYLKEMEHMLDEAERAKHQPCGVATERKLSYKDVDAWIHNPWNTNAQQPVPNVPIVHPKIPSEGISFQAGDEFLGCYDKLQCDECLSFKAGNEGRGCGWCQDTKDCRPGTPEGPLGDIKVFNCSHWDFHFCSGLASAKHLLHQTLWKPSKFVNSHAK